MFLLISMFVRMVQPNTESTTNISSTLRFKVLVAVSRWQSSGVCWCIVDTFCPESVTWHHLLEHCTLDIKHKIPQICLNIHPADHKVMSIISIVQKLATSYFTQKVDAGCKLTIPVPYSIIVCRLICMFLFNWLVYCSVEGAEQKQTACYDIDVEVDDTLKTQMNNFLLSTASQQEIQVNRTLL